MVFLNYRSLTPLQASGNALAMHFQILMISAREFAGFLIILDTTVSPYKLSKEE